MSILYGLEYIGAWILASNKLCDYIASACEDYGKEGQIKNIKARIEQHFEVSETV